jgi:hypothetical protein
MSVDRIATTNTVSFAARYSAVPLILTLFFACACLVRGAVHPALNFDLIPYATLAKQMRGAGGKSETYRELAAKVGEANFQTFVSGPYRERMYTDDAFFKANMPFYSIRPLYIFLSSVAGFLIDNDVIATFVVSAISAALSVIVSYVIAQRIGPPIGPWRLIVPLAWAVSGGLYLASLSTPDALAALTTLLFIHASIGGTWTGGRLIRLVLLSGLMVAARTDSIVFLMALLLAEGLFEPRHRLVASLITFVALSTYFVIQKMSGNYGFIAILNFTLVDGHDKVPNLVFNLPGYLRVLVHETIQVFGEDYESALFLLAGSLLTASCFRAWRASNGSRIGTEHVSRTLILSSGLLLFLIVRFVLFPAPWARYMIPTYVLAGILFARPTDKDSEATPVIQIECDSEQ